MADIWQQFHSLPKAIRDGVSTRRAIAALDDLERQNTGLDLANLIMRVMVREFPLDELPKYLQTEAALNATATATVMSRLRQDVFVGLVADYLGIGSAPAPAPASGRTSVPTPPGNLPVQTAPSLPTVISPGASPRPPQVKPLAPVGQLAPTTHYSEEDANEIERNVARLKQMSALPPNQDLDALSRNILTGQSLAFSEDLLNRRAISIIKARLKDIRTTDETRTMLMREPKLGGLGLDQEIAIQVATAAERMAENLKKQGMIVPPVAPPPPTPISVPKVTQERPPPLPPFNRQAQPAPSPVIPNVTDAPRPSRPIVRPKDIPLPPPSGAPMAMTNPPIPIARPTAPARPVMQGSRGADRPTVADVVRPTKTLGPAEELRSMTVMEFRRLGQGAGDSARRLFDKFQHLQKESFTVWSEAVNGWRQSDIHQLYLDIGRESLERGMPVAQVIADRGRNGQPYLSEHEFNVISDLNRQLQL